jgi:hypothetical protein
VVDVKEDDGFGRSRKWWLFFAVFAKGAAFRLSTNDNNRGENKKESIL